MPTQRSRSSTLVQGTLLVLAVLLLLPFFLMMFMMPMVGMMDGMGISPVREIGMMLLFLLVGSGIGYALYHAFTNEKTTPHDPALEEIRVAYARGEFTPEEFEQRREDLERTK